MGEHRYTYPVVVELRRMVAITGVAVGADTGRHARVSPPIATDAASGQSDLARADFSRQEAQ